MFFIVNWSAGPPRRDVGCDKCGQTGYKGRIGLHELMIPEDALKQLIQERARVVEMFARPHLEKLRFVVTIM